MYTNISSNEVCVTNMSLWLNQQLQVYVVLPLNF